MSEKKLLFELHDFKVMSDSVYLVTDKPDPNAPTGFQDAGSSKLPSDGVGNVFQCPYKPTSKNSGVWDSGFWEYSPCYVNRNKGEVEVLVRNLKENVVEPYRKASGDPNALSHEHPEFFDKAMWSVEEGQSFRTSDPRDVVALYMALLSRELTPKHLKGDTTFADSAYFIIDINEKTKKRDEKASNMFEAIGSFEEMYKHEKPTLDKVLFYLGMNISEDAKIEAYRGLFQSFLQKASTNTEAFNKLMKDVGSEKGKDKLEIYYWLKTKEVNSNKINKSASGVLYYEESEIGADLKSAAENIANNPSLNDIKKEILFSGDEEEQD